MIIFSWKSTIIAKKEIAERTWEIEFERPLDFSFRAGQYIWLIVPKLTHDDPRGNRRAFSITSSPQQKNTFSVILRKTESGYNKSLLCLEPGASIWFEGAFGSSFVLESAKEKEIVIIAGGTGIAPFLSTLRSQGPRTQHKTIIFLNANQKSAFYQKHLEELTEKHQDTLVFKTEEHFSWNDIPHATTFEKAQYYISGPQAMVDHVVPILSHHGIKLAVMHFERSYPSSPHNLTAKQVEKFLAEHTNLGLQVITQSNQHIIITDKNGIVLYANEAAQRVTGYTLEEMKGNTPRLWGGLMSAEYYRKLWEQKSSGKPYVGQMTNRKKNGEIYYALSHDTPLLGEKGEIIGYTATEEDITTQILLQHELETEKTRTESMLISIGDGVVVVDREMKIIVFNAPAEHITGFKRHEVFGKLWQGLLEAKAPDGKQLAVNDSPLFRAIYKGKLTATADLLYTKKDKTTFSASMTTAPVKVDSATIGAIVVFKDITKEKEVDRIKTEFISIASHQLKTPIGISKWYLEALQEDDYLRKAPKTTWNYFDVVFKNNERLSALVRQLLLVSRIDQGRVKNDPKELDLVKAVTEVIQEMQLLAEKKKIKLGLELKQSKLPSMVIDPLLFHEVIENLIANAIEYTPDIGKILVTMEKSEHNLFIRITDSGMGMSAQDKEKAFTKFFRSQEAILQNPAGSGLGLYVVKSYIESWHGTIAIESIEGKGTTFSIQLPISRKE